MQILAIRLKELRQDIGLLQKDIAEKLNITTSAYGFYEQSKRTPDSNTLDKLAEIFNVSTDYLLGRTDIKISNSPTSTIQVATKKSLLSVKEQKDISKDLERFKEKLLNVDELMFDGEPMSEDSVQKILSALEIGMGMVREKNKAKYTPEKYKK